VLFLQNLFSRHLICHVSKKKKKYFWTDVRGWVFGILWKKKIFFMSVSVVTRAALASELGSAVFLLADDIIDPVKDQLPAR
jgi:hypothetical protein